MRKSTGRQRLQWVGLFGGLLSLLAGCDSHSGSSNTNGSLVPVIAVPTLSTIAPRSGPTTGSTAVTLTGTGFQAGATLTIGGTAATAVQVVSATQLTATTPPGPAGAQDVVVTNPEGQRAILPAGFTYVVPPPPAPSLYPGQLFAVFCLAVADVNDDGVPDLVGTSANDVVVLLGQGDGTFQAPQRVAVGSDPQDVAVADVNGDGVPDLVVANAASNDVAVLLGQGNGTFQAAQRYVAGISPSAVAVADVNGDDVPDLVVANRGDPYDSSVSVLLHR